MSTLWNVDDLEIVGYANVLSGDMLPSVVPPVFRLRAEPTRVFLPPYSFNAGLLCNASEVPSSELDQLRDSNDITLFGDGFPARAGFELWIDQSSQPHYQPRDEADRELTQIAESAIANAEEALRRGDLEEADRLSGVAISADDKKLEPLAIKAAIRRAKGNIAGERLMAELAAPVLETRRFELLVDDYSRVIARKHQCEAPRLVSHGPMHKMACMAVPA